MKSFISIALKNKKFNIVHTRVCAAENGGFYFVLSERERYMFDWCDQTDLSLTTFSRFDFVCRMWFYETL